MKKIMNENNLGPIQRVTCVETINAVKKMKLGRAAGPFEVNTEMIVAVIKLEWSFL